MSGSNRWPGGGIQAAADQARRDLDHAATRARPSRVRRLIELTDAMVEDLERQNLSDVSQLSAEWWTRLAVLQSSLPFDLDTRASRPRTPTQLLQLVFEVQERLFDLKGESGGDDRAA
jgi:hypothetical protein